MSKERTLEEMLLRICELLTDCRSPSQRSMTIKTTSYELSDGARSTRDIQKIAGVSTPTITA